MEIRRAELGHLRQQGGRSPLIACSPARLACLAGPVYADRPPRQHQAGAWEESPGDAAGAPGRWFHKGRCRRSRGTIRAGDRSLPLQTVTIWRNGACKRIGTRTGHGSTDQNTECDRIGPGGALTAAGRLSKQAVMRARAARWEPLACHRGCHAPLTLRGRRIPRRTTYQRPGPARRGVRPPCSPASPARGTPALAVRSISIARGHACRPPRSLLCAARELTMLSWQPATWTFRCQRRAGRGKDSSPASQPRRRRPCASQPPSWSSPASVLTNRSPSLSRAASSVAAQMPLRPDAPVRSERARRAGRPARLRGPNCKALSNTRAAQRAVHVIV